MMIKHPATSRKVWRVLPLMAAVATSAALGQQDGRISPQGEGINDPPTLEERIVEERIIAEQAAIEAIAADDEDGIDAPLDEPEDPPTHASREASPELVALASREPEQFIGKTLVLHDGVDATEVGPVLELRKRIRDQEPHLIVDATAYFNTPTKYAVAIGDVARIEGDQVITPEVEGMHLRGLEYYPEDFTELESTAPEDVLADNVDLSEDAVTDPTEEPGAIEIKRF